jgi:hypothetical protein
MYDAQHRRQRLRREAPKRPLKGYSLSGKMKPQPQHVLVSAEVLAIIGYQMDVGRAVEMVTIANSIAD